MAVQCLASIVTVTTTSSAVQLRPTGSKRKTSSEESTAPVKKTRFSAADHFPAEIHSFISQRYLVLNKAGQGTFATVWTCWDVVELRFVAVKICRSTDDVRRAALKEKAIYDHLYKQKSSSKHLIHCIRSFSLKHAGSSHICIVFEAMGSNLDQLTKGRQGLEVVNVRQATREVLLALDALHNAGIIHTDVKPENILISMSEKSEEKLAYEALDALKRIPAARAHIKPLRDHIRRLKRSETIVKLADLGSAQFIDQLNYAKIITTAPYRSFEALMRGPWTPKTDIWSVSCMAFELATGRLLMPVGDCQDGLHLNWMISRLGMPPPHLRYNRNHFDENGGRLDVSPIDKHSVKPDKIVISSQQRFDLKSAESFAALLNSMLAFDPNDRPTARRCLEHPFIAKMQR